MLRIFVYSLLLANILLIAMRMMQPETGDSSAPERFQSPSQELPTIEFALTEMEVKPPSTDHQSMACIQVGPFEDEASMAELKAELGELFDRVQSREQQSIVDKGYWVYIPKYPTRAQAEQVTRDMSVAGVRDFYIVPNGSMANAISLGVYQRRERAEERRQQLTDLGLTLEFMIEPQTEVETRYWMEAGPVNAMNPALIELSHNHPDVQQKQVDCSSGEPQPDDVLEDLTAGAANPVEVAE